MLARRLLVLVTFILCPGLLQASIKIQGLDRAQERNVRAHLSLEKVGEECTETLLAAKDAEQSGDMKEVIYETADLWFHSLVMLSHLGLSYDDILQELERRFDLSGPEEKAQRDKS